MSAETLAAKLDALWLDLSDDRDIPVERARIMNALHDAAQALRTPPAPVEAVAWQEAAEKARTFARCYPHASDGRNTFIMFAEWAESKAVATHPPQPDALPGDLREKVARILDPRLFELIEALNNASGEPPDLRKAASAMRDARMETALNKADAILSLIQSERGEP